MPYKSEKVKIAGTKFDLRVKLSKDQKEAIKILSEKGYSQRKLAMMFNCSKRSIQNIIQPQKEVRTLSVRLNIGQKRNGNTVSVSSSFIKMVKSNNYSIQVNNDNK